MNRRDFLKLTAAAGATTLVAGRRALAAESTTPPRAASGAGRRMVGMPISMDALAQREPAALFDDMQARAGVNALFPFLYTHEPHRGGAPAAGFHGGNYATPHAQFYHDTGLTIDDMTAPEFGKVDLLARLLPEATKRGIAVFPFVLEDNTLPATVPNWAGLYEVDHHGRRTKGHPGGPCFNNPRYQAFMLGLVEDYARSYPIGGMMWGSERQSGVLNALSLSQSGNQDPGKTTCFCEFCQRKGRDRGIDVERAREGFGAIEQFVVAQRKGERPRDGSFTQFWRILLDHPELLAWEKLWVDSRHEFQAQLYGRMKSVNSQLKMGWHIWHNLSFSPFQRAEEVYAPMAAFSDFLRPAVYNNVAGERFMSFVRGAHSSVDGDLPNEDILQMLYRQMGYSGEAPGDRLPSAGLSEDYVEREVRRAVDGVAGSAVQIWPGVDIDVPSGPAKGHVTPASIGRVVKAAFHGGAHGIILSRNYVEMNLANLSGAGAALRELGVIS